MPHGWVAPLVHEHDSSTWPSQFSSCAPSRQARRARVVAVVTSRDVASGRGACGHRRGRVAVAVVIRVSVERHQRAAVGAGSRIDRHDVRVVACARVTDRSVAGGNPRVVRDDAAPVARDHETGWAHHGRRAGHQPRTDQNHANHRAHHLRIHGNPPECQPYRHDADPVASTQRKKPDVCHGRPGPACSIGPRRNVERAHGGG
jgi:hypothetical protein